MSRYEPVDIFEGNRAVVRIVTGAECTRCKRVGECVEFSADDPFYGFSLCTVMCWGRLLDSIEAREPLPAVGD